MTMRCLSTLSIAAALAAVLTAGCSHSGSQATGPSPAATVTSTAPLTAANPFYAPSTLPFGAPPFDRIHNADYQPAIDEGMRQQLREVAAITAQSAPPTFDNTIVPLERSGALLTRVMKVFNGVTSANTNDTLQQVQSDEAPKLAAHSDAIFLDDALFRRVSQVYDKRAQLGLTPEQKYLVERYHLDFVRAGAQLAEADKTKLRAMNQEESKLTTDFQNRLLAATKAGAPVFKDSSSLEGLSAADVAAASEAAKERSLPGEWVLPLQNTTQQPAQASLVRRAVRQQLYEASSHRADRGDANDTRAIIQRIAQLRADRAKLLGYATAGDYVLADQMAKTPSAAIKLLSDIGAPAVAKAHEEAARMQSLIDQQHGGFTLEPWDWQFYAEQVRKADYDLDESQIKPYFELDRVLQDGVFYAANRLYGITFKERKDIPVYQPDVRVFEVFDADGKSLALFYCDYFKRDNKSGGAWMDSFVDQSGLLGTKPVVFNVANFTKPAPGQPALLSFDDVTTMFHEFGHALHGMFSHVEYPMLSGTAVPSDFVEFPSQFNEHWALDPDVFAHYAKHYQTGAPMPQALVDRIKKSRTFDQGFALTEYVEAALIDMAWHSLPAGAPKQNVDSFEMAALERYHVAMREVPPRYHTTYFAHIWNGGYQAGYYAYLWAEVLDDDAYAWFTEHGGLTRANGQHFRDMILSRGGTEDVADLYRAFRGRDASVEPLLVQRGLKPSPGGG
ncbi:MAG: M3 family metallopeptidase [Gemmatimonadales bacterium]